MYYVFQYFSPVTSKKWYKSTKASQSTLQKTCYSLVGRVLIANYQWLFELQTSENDCQLEIEMLYQKAAHVAHASFVRQITGTIYWRTVKPWNDHHGSCSRNLTIILEDIEKKVLLRIPKLSEKPEILLPWPCISDRFNYIGFSKDDKCINSHSQVGVLPDHIPLALQVRVLFPFLRM